ncbi:MAG: class II aldolase/adducin family protein [Pseudomonadota bacterium]|jgi:ribulose-5-phosphate 4-epimerase/fuculose-1-phosphate aldolase
MAVQNIRHSASRFSEAEWQARVDLAACYRLADRNRMSKVIWNHITARVPGEDTLLINRFGMRYDEVTASNLMKIDAQGKPIDGTPEELNFTGYVIHSAVHDARPEVACVMHTHSRGGQTISALQCGLLPLCQEAMLYYDALAYHDYEGLSDDVDEKDRIARSLGDKDQMVLRNHGLLTVGRNVAEAYWRMYQLELACLLQVEVLSTGQDYTIPPHEVCLKARQQYIDGKPGFYEWPALLRELDRSAPDYKS